MSNILVINAGSTTVKYKYFSNETILFDGMFMNFDEGKYFHKDYLKDEKNEIEKLEYDNCLSGIKNIIDQSLANSKIDAIGFRVVHGGEKFIKPTILNEQLIQEIESLSDLAPLHNPPALFRIRQSLETFPDVIKYAIFDTEFHFTIPEKAYLYAIPYKFYRENKIRRYGFHGISHEYLSNEVDKLISHTNNSDLKLITCHLGGGASISAIKGGRCIDTSMGFTPLEGLMMSTRAGDIDDGVQNYLEEKLGYSEKEIARIMNYESGLLGVSEKTSDMIELLRLDAEGDIAGKRAMDMYIFRIQKYIGAYFVALGGLDALVFSGGVGSGSDVIRKKICAGLQNLGVEIDDSINDGKIDVVGNLEIGKGNVKIFAIQTNEELMIARKYEALTD